MTPYSAVGAADPLSQGDVFADCPLYALAPPDGDPQGRIAPRYYTGRAVVLTQACDIAQAKTDQVVVAPVFTTESIVTSGILKPAAVRDQLRTHRMFGWYFLPAAEPPIPLPESVADLRQLYTLHRRALEQLVADGKRVCRLVTPYREHLAQHFAVTYMRIALPDPYPTAP